MFTIKPEEGNQWSSGLLITNKTAICNNSHIPASYLGYLFLNVPIMSTVTDPILDIESVLRQTNLLKPFRERSCSVVECLTRD